MNEKYTMVRATKEDSVKLKDIKFDFRVNSVTEAITKLIEFYEKNKGK